AEERNKIYENLKNKRIDLIVGTHSLINNSLSFSDIAFAVMDEQHRFGVAQRTAFIEKSKDTDVLTLTATPIPRTLRLTAFGDIDFFNIEKRHHNNISTHIVTKDKKEDMFSFVATQCQKGEKAFVVVSKIENDTRSDISSVKDLYDKLKKGVFKNIKTECLHSKLKESTKQSIMKRFISGETSMIIATTVIEVGVDVDDAGIMVVMDAENYGLAALHQLRGRVGRKGQKAYCFLYTEKEITKRLITIKDYDDGFVIAEKDFEIRGGGDFLGMQQSGKTDETIDLKDISFAKKIIERLDIKALKKELLGEAKRNKLKNVSLT
ncbi:MAG: helicase-related protein, partial [Bacillota bacterium]